MTLSAATIPDLAELNRMIARFAPVELHADASKLSPGDQKALAKLLDAAHVIDDIFLEQVWSGNQALRAKLAADPSPLGKARLRYFDLNKGPWSDLDDHAAFLPGVPEKQLPGANFYPADMGKADVTSLPGYEAVAHSGLGGISPRIIFTITAPQSTSARRKPGPGSVLPLARASA